MRVVLAAFALAGCSCTPVIGSAVEDAVHVVAQEDLSDYENEFEGLSLLQLRATSGGSTSPQHKYYSNASTTGHAFSGHAFGCTGRTTAQDMITCGLWGDVHQHKKFHASHVGDSNGIGWYWLAKSKDSSFQAQAFYRAEVSGGVTWWTTMSHFAFKFGDQTLFLDRENIGGRWIWKYFWNGEEKSFADTPLEVGPVYWVNKAAGQMVQEGAQMDRIWHPIQAKDKERMSCFEYGAVSVWTSFADWQDLGGPFGNPAAVEIEGNADFLDDQFGQCAFNQKKVDPKDILVTVAQNTKVCSDDKFNPDQCDDPDPPPTPPTKEELCEKNGVEMSHAEELCADQQAHSQDIFDDCTFDVCASTEAKSQLNAVGGAELEAAMMNPEAKCTVKSDDCMPCTICSAFTSVDLSNVVQNNLGGLGPDSGAEEIRYKNAINLDGKVLDVVLTAVDAYVTPKTSKNGYLTGGFGRFTMKVKTSTNFKFSFFDSGTDEPVAVKDLALTFYDLDQGKKGQQQETISACAAQEVYTTSDTELEHTSAGACHSFMSTARGTGKDNPSVSDELTKTQAARSVTFEFHARASISFSATISRAGRTPRPVLFSFEPQVACGASDAETRCAQ